MVRTVLDFLKRNLFNIGCGVVVLLSLGLGGLGVSKMSDVGEELQTVGGLHGQFSRFKRGAANERTIEAEKTRVETIKTNYQGLLQAALTFDQYEPLPPPEGETFFPTPTQRAKLEFPQIYTAAFDRLYDRLKAGVPPSAADIAQTQEEMDEEARAAEAFAVDVDDGKSEAPSEGGPLEEEEHKSGLITVAAARQSPAARASIRRARSIYCYAEMSAFDLNKQIAEPSRFSVPAPADMWKAQVSLWVQQDVVGSLARINEAAAAKLEAEGRSAWVGVLPVKDLISIRVSDYLPTTETRVFKREVTGREPADPPGSSGDTFTHTTSNDLYEVVQFTLKMVVDPRELPLIIDEICKNRFHTLLSIEYAYDPGGLQTLDMKGRIYGSEPAVQVLMDFETIFFGDKYRRMMPDAVLAQIKKTRPTDEPS